jgi:hypothetical protein
VEKNIFALFCNIITENILHRQKSSSWDKNDRESRITTATSMDDRPSEHWENFRVVTGIFEGKGKEREMHQESSLTR